MFISIVSLVALLNCASVLTIPHPVLLSEQESLLRRQVSVGAPKNSTALLINIGMGMSEAEKEAREEIAEKLPGLNTIASAYKELYYHDRYGSRRNDTATLVRMAGQAVGMSAPSGDPEAVAKAVLVVFEPYNAQTPAGSSIRTANKNIPSTDAPSLNTIAHTLHELWEKMVESPGPKPDTTMLVKSIGQAIATSSPSGDPTIVAKAIESAASKVMTPISA